MKLFKLFSVGALMLGAVAVSNAQEDASNKDSMAISFGVKGGVNFATVNGSDQYESPDSRTSFHVGALAEFPLADIFSIQVEALYSGQGFEIASQNILGQDRKIEYQLDYINVPVLAKVYVMKGLSLEAGPQFNFLVNEEIDSDPNNNGGDNEQDNAKDFDFGFAGGLTFQTEMGLFASARYYQGVTNIIDGANDTDPNVNNSVFQIGVGFKF